MSDISTVHDALDREDWNLEEIKLILQRDSSSIKEEVRRQFPLNRVLKDQRCSVAIVKLLLHYGADPNFISLYSPSALYLALYCTDRVEIVRALVEAGARADNIGCSSLSAALSLNAEMEVIRLLLSVGADLFEPDISGDCPLFYALQYFNVSAFGSLLDLQDVDVNTARNLWNGTLLHNALSIDGCTAAFVEFLIGRGIGIDSEDEYCNTPLHMAVQNPNCHFCVFDVLLKKGSSINCQNEYGDTPLELAIEHSNPDIVQLLLKYCFLQNPDFDIEKGIRGHKLQGIFLGYANECQCEVRRMNSENVGNGRTLFEFLQTYAENQMKRNEAEAFNVDRLLKILAGDSYPIYSDIISSKFERSLLEYILDNCKVYTFVKDSRPGVSWVIRKVELNYDGVRVLAKYVNDNDLLKFIIAFHN